MVDSSDESRVDESGEELGKLLEEETLQGVPVLVYANKQDLLNAISESEISESLGLEAVSAKTGLVFRVQPCSAKNGEGLQEGMAWLVEKMNAGEAAGAGAAKGPSSDK